MKKREEFVQSEGISFPGKTYAEELLMPVFNDQRDYLFEVMFDIHRAHVIMLAEQKIIEESEAKTMLEGINKVGETDWTQLSYLPEFGFVLHDGSKDRRANRQRACWKDSYRPEPK